MKKTLFVLLCTQALPASTFAQQVQGAGDRIIFQVTIFNPDELLGGGHKMPVQPPYVTYQDYTLFIWGEHAGYTLTLLDDSETVVYQTYIPAGTQTVSLPESLSGSYTLQLSNDSYMFTGYINL